MINQSVHVISEAQHIRFQFDRINLEIMYQNCEIPYSDDTMIESSSASTAPILASKGRDPYSKYNHSMRMENAHQLMLLAKDPSYAVYFSHFQALL